MQPKPFAPRRPAALLAAALALLGSIIAIVALPSPARADDLNLSCLGGERLSDAELARGATVVVIWASWSPRSRDIAERVSALAGRWGGRARVMAVSFQEDRAVVERFVAGKRFGAPVCLDPDGAFSRKYNVASLPGLVVVRDGQVAYHGKLSEDSDQILGGLLR
jgi:thiol-disulfide isomerase/thioredoxin